MERSENSLSKTTSAAHSNNKGEDQSTQSSTTERLVRAPRNAVLEYILMVFTFSFYIPFWSVGRAKDMKAASGQNYTPWLWFLAPWIWIAGLVAFNSMFQDLAVMENSEQKRKWAIWSIPWLIAFALLGLFFNIQNVLQLPFIFYSAAVLAFCALFAFLQHRFNKWKHHDSTLTFKGKTTGYTWYEWLLLVICTPFYIWIMYLFAWPSLKAINIASYEDSQEIVFENLGFKISIEGTSWRKIESSDAVFEMLGPGDVARIFIYDYDTNQTLDDVAASRFEILNDAYSDLDCSETKRFESSSAGMRSTMLCNARDWGEMVEAASVVIDVDNQLKEFVGITTNSNRKKTTETGRQIRSMANSFRVLSRDKDE